jgi:hypothetical protein
MNSYPINELVQVSVQFTRVTDNVPLDPTTVTLTITPPDDVPQQVVSNVTRTGVGAYAYQFVVSAFGLYVYRWQGLGVVIANSGNMFFRGV